MARPTFVENLAVAVDAIGLAHAPIAWGIANVGWESAEQRDAFLALIARDRPEPEQPV